MKKFEETGGGTVEGMMEVTLKQSVDQITERYTYSLMIGNFLDSFYSKYNTDENRKRVIQEKPTFKDESMGAYMAAMVELLCEWYNFECPAWIFKEVYYLTEPWYPGGIKGEELRALLREESPRPFKERNLFVSDNAITRA